jgi:hypothetical protein
MPWDDPTRKQGDCGVDSPTPVHQTCSFSSRHLLPGEAISEVSGACSKTLLKSECHRLQVQLQRHQLQCPGQGPQNTAGRVWQRDRDYVPGMKEVFLFGYSEIWVIGKAQL